MSDILLAPSVSRNLFQNEKISVDELLDRLKWTNMRHTRAAEISRELVEHARATPQKSGSMQSFLQEFSLETAEGIALMTLAEALLRVPDAGTANHLIRETLTKAEWAPSGSIEDWMVRAATAGLAVSRATLESLISRLGEPVIRKAIQKALHFMGGQFIVGETIDKAFTTAKQAEFKGYRFSYDMLGEGARTEEDATRYFQSYQDLILGVTYHYGTKGDVHTRPGMSVKLSALHPRYEAAQADDCVPYITERLLKLCEAAASSNITLTVDAEESYRLETSLAIFHEIIKNPALNGWDGFGMAIQAYDKRAIHVVDTIADWAKTYGRRLTPRLVKGAYWDTEIKLAQVNGYADYPLFTRKVNTDLSYMACANAMLQNRNHFWCMFGTHNAYTVGAILELASDRPGRFEFQRLQGMGNSLYDQIVEQHIAPVSIYGPIGPYRELLPYLVRRMLENGANSSFVNLLHNTQTPVETVISNPVATVTSRTNRRHAQIPLPRELYGSSRKNSAGLPLFDLATQHELLAGFAKAEKKAAPVAAPLLGGKEAREGRPIQIYNPAIDGQIAGYVYPSDTKILDRAFATARAGFMTWSRIPADLRADCLERLADLLEKHEVELIRLCVIEAGKTYPDAIAEIREAVDFCRYYASLGRTQFDEKGQILAGPTGESNIIKLEARGVFVCISPWNFPLAIYLGQITAALMAGNAVIAKPAEQTPLIAAYTAGLILEAGVPEQAFTLLPGDGEFGKALVAHSGVDGVAFTGSTEAALNINRSLASKDGPIVPLIAETGGLNAMIVDSSALAEQVIDATIISAFGSAGQRCSALRLLCLQEDVADKMIEMLKGAMAQLRVGDPALFKTDIGPVIDDEALARLKRHAAHMEKTAKLVARAPEPQGDGTFFTPVAYELKDVTDLKTEIFGPILHIVRFKREDMTRLIKKINANGYALTFGIQSRIGTTIAAAERTIRAGNVYINRSIIGAVVGVQPFGGYGLSGTGPKAGGPHYMLRFAVEKSISNNITVTGGNLDLITLSDLDNTDEAYSAEFRESER